MRQGVRDLRSLTNFMDPGSQAVIEAILRKIIKIEDTYFDAENDQETEEQDSLPPPPSLTRQYSIGTDTRNIIGYLQRKISGEEFKKILDFLVEKLASIRSNPGNINLRRIKKTSNEYCSYVSQHSEVAAIMSFVGFVEDEDVLTMIIINKDAVVRTLAVLTQLKDEIGK